MGSAAVIRVSELLARTVRPRMRTRSVDKSRDSEEKIGLERSANEPLYPMELPLPPGTVTERMTTPLLVAEGSVGTAAKKTDKSAFEGVAPETVREWFRITHLGRLIEDKAYIYIRGAGVWSYHAPFAGHDGIQLAIARRFVRIRFPVSYYRDLLTCLSAGMSVDEILLNGLRKTAMLGGGRHMSNHFAKPEVGIQNVSSCTGNQLHAAGVARAIKYYGADSVAISSRVKPARVKAMCICSTARVVRRFRHFRHSEQWVRSSACDPAVGKHPNLGQLYRAG